jgi:hypothetical protein
VESPRGERGGGSGRRHRDTEEQVRRRHINEVLTGIQGETQTTFSLDKDRLDDMKASKLEQIGQLRMNLEEEGLDCSGLRTLTSESSIDEIDSVLNQLRLRNDRSRYASLGEEVIIGAAEGLATVFNGQRTIPLLGIRPNYKGYATTVAVKLHRMRFETSQVVGELIKKHQVGPVSRMFLELLPSLFLYPRNNQARGAEEGLETRQGADVSSALASIRATDVPVAGLDDARGV